ncbi:PREDICTED: uncharacterized protein LOC104602300 [Nelumbo nucifera]|uniref:Uncharacterized protein LOC104602300 n=2 Tax=Nelumbo nucifera TaxID=4432 RepID=A0A1U8A9V9_NELNU|nr:PREDICTED: uncharacterized protein LOC104602300 [Nelumbo nucifera]DAD18565.1 TPA_asm: hypothetical protein HUJ06_020028 [Nelumbo nucifera]
MGLEVLLERSWQNTVILNNARSDIRVGTLFDFHENGMLTGGDFNLNSTQKYSDSLKEFLKQTMLHHEAIFKNQVHELHRLYRIQKTLMKDISWRDLDGYNSWTANTQPVQLPFQDLPAQRPLVEERTFSAPPMVSPKLIANQDMLEQQSTYTKLQHGPVDLQLPADEYISHVGNGLPRKMNLWPSLGESTEAMDFFHSSYSSDPEVVKLSLNGGEGQSKEISNRKMSNKKTSFSTQVVIDLEESTEMLSDKELKPLRFLVSEAPNSVDKHEAQVSVLAEPSFSLRTKKDVGHGLSVNCSVANCTEDSEEQKSLFMDTGLNGSHSSSPFTRLFANKQQSSSDSTAHLDLNAVQLDESSCLSNDPAVSVPSLTARPQDVFQGCSDASYKGTQPITCWKLQNYHTSGTSYVFEKENSTYSGLIDSKGKDCSNQACDENDKLKSSCGIKRVAIDLESLPEDALDACENLSNNTGKSSRENVDLLLGLPNGFQYDNQTGSSTTPFSKLVENHPYVSSNLGLPLAAGEVRVGPVNFDKSEEDTVSSSPCKSQVVIQDGHFGASNAAGKSNYETDNNSSSVKDLQSGTEDKHQLEVSNLSAFEESGTTQLGSQIAEALSCEQELNVETGIYACMQGKCCDGTEPEYQYGSEQEKDREMDTLVQIAAESLIQFSMENSLCSQDGFAKAAESDELLNEEKAEQPEYSSDSFESITLRLTESSIDDYSVSSAPVEVNEIGNKPCGWNLKRGRRMKDFQREILPGLASLSRHEIWEDINIIGAVIKSKEYKNRSRKVVVGDNWCAPVRSRRSKLNYVGRRNYS